MTNDYLKFPEGNQCGQLFNQLINGTLTLAKCLLIGTELPVSNGHKFKLSSGDTFKIDLSSSYKTMTYSTANRVLINEIIVNQPYQMQSQRFIWIAGWDDYRGGMTEVSLFIPDRSCDFPPAIEHFNIDYTGWYPVIEKYETSGELVMGKENIPENIYNIWERAGDFMGAGIYKGDIAELVKDLSSHISVEKESELLPDLKRKNDFHSVKSAIVFSLFDALKEDLWKDFPDLIDEIKLRASYDYGIDIESVHAKGRWECFIEEAFISNRHLLRNVTDIIWTDSVGYEKCMNKVEICKQLYVSFDSTDKLIVRIR